MASLKAEKPAVGAQRIGQSKKEAKPSDVAQKASASKSNSASKKPAQRSQDPPKKVHLLVNCYMILIFKHGLSLCIMESYSLILAFVEERGQVCCEELNERKGCSIFLHAKESYHSMLVCFVMYIFCILNSVTREELSYLK